MTISKLVYEGMHLFKVYHSGTRTANQAIRGGGNDPWALLTLGVIGVIIVGVIIYFRKKYKQKYNLER